MEKRFIQIGDTLINIGAIATAQVEENGLLLTLTAPYRAGAQPYWLKVPNPDGAELAVYLAQNCVCFSVSRGPVR